MRKAPLAALLLCALTALGQSTADQINRLRADIAANPNASLPHLQLGQFYFDNKNYELAANEFREALNGDLQPGSIVKDAHMRLGWIFDLAGQFDRAAKEYTLALQAPVRRTVDFTIIPARPIEQPEPEYTDEARVAGLEGEVSVHYAVSADGQLNEVHVTRSLGLGLDEKAVEALKRSRFEPGSSKGHHVDTSAVAAIQFRLPDKQSRWHLLKVEFQSPEGATRPVFSKAKYPLGTGISGAAVDEGRILGAVGRSATAQLLFVIDSHGIPTNFEILNASDDVWGPEAIGLVHQWQFSPAMKDGVPIPVPCVVDLAWGPGDLPASLP